MQDVEDLTPPRGPEDEIGQWPFRDEDGEINPEFLRLSERLRAHAFYSKVFDIKTTHLILFGMLLVEHNAAAQMHALAARRAGATWQELHKVVELAAATKSLGPANQGGSMLKSLRDQEQQS